LAIGLVVVAVAMVGIGWRWRGNGKVTLAVLPFENIGGDPERDSLAVGLTDETNASLAQIDPEHLSVKGRMLHYAAIKKAAPEIGRELSVDYLLEATIRAEGSKLRVTTTLTRVRDQEHVWSKFYDREPTSLLGLEQELSTDIAQQIRVQLSPDRVSALAQRQTQNSDALYAYFKARSFAGGRNPEAMANARNEYKRALTLDPNYALAWFGLGDAYASSTVNSDADPLEVGPRARDAAAEAIRINPNLAEAHRLDGYVKWLLDWKWAMAEAAFRRAIAIDSSDATAFRSLGHALSQSGRHSEAETQMRRARELEPLEPMSYALSSQVAFQAREYPAAIEHARHAILIGPDLWIGYMQLGQAYQQMGETAVALEALTDAARRSHGNSKAISLKGYLLAKMGRVNEARDVLNTLDATSHYVPPYAMALVHLGLDDREQVFAWLDRAYDARDVHLIYLPVDPKWDSYRADPRFVALLARCGFPASR
jgi:TolB-like protein/Tfp pilus assembly protein PilF